MKKSIWEEIYSPKVYIYYSPELNKLSLSTEKEVIDLVELNINNTNKAKIFKYYYIGVL